MTLKRIWIGSVGPFLFDDAETYKDDPTMVHKGIRSEGPLSLDDSDVEMGRSGSDMTFKDPSAGTKTLSQLGSAIQADGLLGRTLRHSYLDITDGSVTGIGVQLVSRWNGNSAGPVVNIEKGGSSGGFSLDASGGVVTIDDTNISGDAVTVMTNISINGTSVAVVVQPSISSGDIVLSFTSLLGVAVDLSLLVNTGNLRIDLLYIASA